MALAKFLRSLADRVDGPIARRRFEAARPTRIAGGFTANGSRESSRERVKADLRGLVMHSRYQARNNDYMKAYLKMVRRHIVGPNGIRLQAQSRDDNGQLDRGANKIIEDAWKDWGRFGECTVDGQYSWLGVQQISVSTAARDGTMFIREFIGPKYGKYGYQLQLLPIDFLDIDKNIDLGNGRRIVAGVELDKFDRPVAYHMFKHHPGDRMISTSAERLRLPSSEVFPVFVPDELGQGIGIPWAHTALRRLNMLRGYEEAALTAARAGASKMGFLEKTDADDLDPSEVQGLEHDESGNLIEEFEPGLIEELPYGYKFSEFNPGYPNGEMEPFMKVSLRGAAAGLGVSYSSLANDLEGANFSSLRSGLGEERDEWKTMQSWLTERLPNRVHSNWLRMALLTQLPLPVEKFDKFNQANWRPRGWPAVNPVQESNSNETDMKNNLRAPQDVVAERGDDLDEVYERIAEARELAEAHGLEFSQTSSQDLVASQASAEK